MLDAGVLDGPGGVGDPPSSLTLGAGPATGSSSSVSLVTCTGAGTPDFADEEQ